MRNVTCGDSSGSDRVEKDWVRVLPGLVWGKEKKSMVVWRDLVSVEGFLMMELMVAVLMS